MLSLSTVRSRSPRFRVCWRGYDQAQVDAFLRDIEADQKRLQEGLAQLELLANFGENGRRELHRLTSLRREVAGCLETSIAALRTATELLSASETKVEPEAVVAPAAAVAPRGVSLTRGRTPAIAGSIAACGLIAILFSTPRLRAITARSPVATTAPVASVAPIASPMKSQHPAKPQPVTAPVKAASAKGLLLTLTARRPCWIGTSIDGGQPLERMLSADETIMLRADNETVLRVGDAGALALMINNRPAKPLGSSGQVTTARINRTNYATFLAND